MTDKRNAVVEAAREVDLAERTDPWPAGRVVKAREGLRDALVALESPLPSNKETHRIYCSAHGGDSLDDTDNPRWARGRNALIAYTLRLAAKEAHARGGEDVRRITACLNELATQMEDRS